jgi:predicted RNA-binding protein with PUA-like domain
LQSFTICARLRHFRRIFPFCENDMAHWLVKTEPSTYSFDDLLNEKRTAWTGVKNAAAQLHLRGMKVGDEVLVYHSGDDKAAIGIAKVVRAAYPDPTNADGKAVAVDLAVVRRLKKPVTLAQVKADKQFKEWALVRISRLSVMPTTPQQFAAVLALAGE